MLRLVFYEIRKNYLRRYIVAAFILFVLLDIMMIYKDYQTGISDPSLYFMARNHQTQGMWTFYDRMHEKLDGPLTTDKVNFIVDENKRLGSLTADGTFSREYQADTYTGYLWADFVMINKYFYQPMKYAAFYGSNTAELVKKAEDNIAFFTTYQNSFEKKRNQYIRDHYSAREITVFYDGKLWEGLLKYDFSDLLIILLVLLGVVPIFTREKETKMGSLIMASKQRKLNMIWAKTLSVFIYVLFLAIIFFMINMAEFKILYHLSGASMPLYAIEAYQFTPLNCSVGEFYLLALLFKIAGLFIFGLWLSLLSALFPKVIHPYMVGAVLIVVGVYVSGYLAAAELSKTMMALFSPFTLLKGNELFMNLLGFNVAGLFFLRSTVCLLLQAASAAILLLVIRYRCFVRLRLKSNL